jgi:hypothetical protein
MIPASPPGKPPSSRGNSDIDDQVDRYIRDQRVVTIVNDPSSSDTTQTQSPRAPLPPNHIDITRTIAQQHCTLAHNIDSSPPLPADRDTEDTLHRTSDTLSAEHRDHSRAAPYGHITFGPHNHVRQPSTQESTPDPTSSDSDYSTSSSPPPLIEDSSDEDDQSGHHLEISDDTRNAIHRRYAQLQTSPHITYPNPPRILAVEHTVFDIRTATNDSDSTPIYPDPSDSSYGETPQYWTENQTPPHHHPTHHPRY